MKTYQKIIIIILSVLLIAEIVAIGILVQSNQSQNQGENNLTSEEKAYPHLTFLSYDEYQDQLAKKEKSIFVIVQTTCGYCLQYKPILDEIAEEYQIPIYIVDILTMTDAEISEFLETAPYFTENPQWGTPLTLIMENKEQIAVSPGAMTKEATISFYQEQGLIPQE